MKRTSTTTAGQFGSRLRLARNMRGLTLRQLAEKVGCSESLISKFENGRNMPSLPMLHGIVQVLETNIGWMFEETSLDGDIVFRAGVRPRITLDPQHRGEGITLERVIPYGARRLLQCNIHHIEVGGRSAGPIEHEGEEVGYVLQGQIELEVSGKPYLMQAGDTFVFASRLPHAYRNAGLELASIFWVNTPPTF